MVLQPISNDELADQVVDEETANNLVGVIETVIDSLDSDNTAMVNRSETRHLWKFKYGTVEVFVQLTGLTEEDTLTVWSMVLKLPAKDEPTLMRQLLERNWANTLEARFGIFDDQSCGCDGTCTGRPVSGEISRAITIVATIADESDEPLQQEFGT